MFRQPGHRLDRPRLQHAVMDQTEQLLSELAALRAFAFMKRLRARPWKVQSKQFAGIEARLVLFVGNGLQQDGNGLDRRFPDRGPQSLVGQKRR